MAGVGGGDHAVESPAGNPVFVEGTDAGKMVVNGRESEVADTLPTVLAAPSPAPIAPVPPAEPLMIDGNMYSVSLVVQWPWPPFVETNCPFVYSVSPLGVEWLTDWLPGYNKVEGTQALAHEYMSHFKTYNLTQLLPHNPSHSQQKAADNHILKKIDNLLRDSHTKSGDPPDMMELLFQQVCKSTACDCWARSDPTYKVKEAEHMVINKWTPDMDHQVSFPIQMQAWHELWNELSEEDKDKWEAEALRQKDIVPTSEKFHAVSGEKIPDYSSLPESEAYDISLCKGVADFSKEDVKDVPTWKPKVAMPKLGGGPLVKLSGMVLTDDKGEIVTVKDTLREAIINYMNMTFGK
ncbi:hypothetical protein M422DRAFT_247546 [Sphaerobolus stellatus SS14]|nr:hypothetical protein M422DRAFT_247546 [Sphaerobolus stellatus SS14]